MGIKYAGSGKLFDHPFSMASMTVTDILVLYESSALENP
ncbi:hypothetical protein EV06_1311 [Prochlorococcus sp. MIT 0602]|nr:hypothetical protein EV06_1311 [Prochlorococcus sp. MIT 0602]KGG17719.1 hypothetical protein EV07_1159 [Prochlorococcus sp. MIT 0603]